MKKIERRQLQVICKHFQKDIMRSITTALLLPVLCFAGGFFWIYLNLHQWPQETIPIEDIQLLFKQVLLILACLTPLLLLVCWIISWRVTYRTVGALGRITLELRQRIQSGKKTPIKIRKNDSIQTFVKQINRLLKTPTTD